MPRQETKGFGIVVVNKKSDVVSLVWEQFSEVQNALLYVRPCLEFALEDTTDSNDATIFD